MWLRVSISWGRGVLKGCWELQHPRIKMINIVVNSDRVIFVIVSKVFFIFSTLLNKNFFQLGVFAGEVGG